MKENMMRRWVVAGVGGAAALAALAVAAPANATVSEYQSKVAEELPVVVQSYGMPALVQEGYTICKLEGSGVTGVSDVIDSTVRRMPMSRSAAIALKVYAEHYLGC